MAKISKDGVTITTLQEYKNLLVEKYLGIDSDWNISPESPDGMAIAVWSEILANLDESVVSAYHSVDPNSAMGQQLDRIALFAGIFRQAATYSTSIVKFYGSPLITIPVGTLVRHRVSSTIWRTDSSVITDSMGYTSVSVTCQTAGAQNANAGTLTIIASAGLALTSVTNDAAASLGRDEESNNAFRIRRNISVSLPGNNQIDNIHSAIGNIEGVKQTKIYENNNSETDSNGVYSHSMAIFIDGGEISNIVNSIATRKNPGCGLNQYNTFPNKISIDTFTPNRQPINITFFRPEYITIYVKIDVVSNSLVDSNKTSIKEKIVNYTIYGFEETTGFAKKGFEIGEDIASGRLFTPANFYVAGDDYVKSITIGTSKNDITRNVISMKFNQLGVFDAENIEVNIIKNG